MRHTELRQFLLESNRVGLTPAEKDVFLYYQSRGRSWHNPDAVVAVEIGRSRSAVCEARNRLKGRQWIGEKSPFQIEILKSFSVGTATEKSQSPVRLPTEPVGTATERVGTATGQSERRLKVAVNDSNDKDLQSPKRNIEEKEVKEEKRKRAHVAKEPDDVWIESLKKEPLYAHINIARELGKAQKWITDNPGRKFTRKFVTNWLNRIEPPLIVPDTKPQMSEDERKMREGVAKSQELFYAGYGIRNS